jgi:nitrite reductase/ring-hydroxylating ferredoxin subunit
VVPEVVRRRLLAGAELAPGQLRRVVVEGRALCVARIENGEVFAIDDTCTHEEETLSEGELMGCEVECPWHFGRFDVRTGAAVALPATEPVGTYRVSVEGDDVLVHLPERQPEVPVDQGARGPA